MKKYSIFIVPYNVRSLRIEQFLKHVITDLKVKNIIWVIFYYFREEKVSNYVTFLPLNAHI